MRNEQLDGVAVCMSSLLARRQLSGARTLAHLEPSTWQQETCLTGVIKNTVSILSIVTSVTIAAAFCKFQEWVTNDIKYNAEIGVEGISK